MHKRAATHVNTHTHTHRHSLPPLPHRNRYKSKRDVWDKKKVKPHRTTQGKWPETMRSGWLMAKAEWMAEGRQRRERMTRRKQHYKRTPHRELAMTHSICRMLIPLPNILAITGGVSSRQKEGKEKTHIGTRQQYGTLSHDSLTTSMFGNAQTCYFLPRKQAPKRDG